MTDEQLMIFLDIANEPGAQAFIDSLSPTRRALFERVARMTKSLVLDKRIKSHANKSESDSGAEGDGA